MLKTKTLEPGCIYLFKSESSASSHFFESKSELEIFIEDFKRYLKNYITILVYQISQEGWAFVVKLKSRKTVRKHFIKDSNRKDRFTWPIWRIIGERIRLLLCNFRQKLNTMQGRTGSNVRKSYEKIIFETLKEAKRYINKIRKGKLKIGQKNKNYCPKKSNFDKDRILKNDRKAGISNMCSKWIRKQIKNGSKQKENFTMKVLRLLEYSENVLRYLINKTNLKHSSPTNT